MAERTIVILKPDAVRRGILGEVLHRFECRGLKIIGMKFQKLEEETLGEHYAHHREKPFFPKLIEFMRSAPALVIALQGNRVVEVVRAMCGSTHGAEAGPGTIRGDFALSIQQNIVHASENVDIAKQELARFFSDDELFDDYIRADWESIYAVDERE
ncbi:MAG: nucleoside-diphosphate kinase [Patescibacteria group bacterium]|jgi:nucleoside-diphosphate kinase